PAARREPRLLPSAAPRLGSQVPAVLRAWHAPAPPDSLARPRGHQCLPVAGRPADESGPCRRRGTPDRGGLVTALPPTAQDQAGFVVELEQFSGPLDLLLHLIREDEVDITDLLAAAERVIALIPEPVLHRVVPRPLDVEGATARIEALLAERAALGWGDVVGERPTIVDVLSAFIALLELAKRGALRVHQEGPFAPMQIRRESPR